MVAGAVHSFFKALDQTLKIHQMRLADFVAAFEVAPDVASRGLDQDEFAAMVERIMPQATPSQVGWA